MNKQPFHHQTEIENCPESIEDNVIRLVKGVSPDIIDVDVANGELLFMATRSLCDEVERALEDAGFKLSYSITAEPGDPADLM